VEVCSAGGNDTEFALEGFLRSIRTGERPAADAQVGHRATLASLLALRALDTGRTVSWDEVAGS
jgi:predicted dehydrogenase